MHPATTKLPLLLDPAQGFWSMVHALRTDWSMLLGSVFLLLTGGGNGSVDAKLAAATSPRNRALMKHRQQDP